MSSLALYRDDGPLATMLGRPALLPVPPAAITLAGLAVLAAALVAVGTGLALAPVGLAAAAYVLLAGAVAGETLGGTFDWLVPPMLRAGEYGTLLALAYLAEPEALAACFVLIGVLAFHHYDIVYRLRHQSLSPPAWLRFAGGGWELRLLAAYLLVLLGWLTVGVIIAAAALAVLYLVESVASWHRFSQGQRPVLYEQEEDEEE